MRKHGGLGQGGGREGGEKCPILLILPAGANGLPVCAKEIRVKTDVKVSWPEQQKKGLAINSEFRGLSLQACFKIPFKTLKI